MISQKLKILSEVNKKINKIQKVLTIKINSEEGEFDFIIPNDENILLQSDELGLNNLYQKLKFHNFGNENIDLILFYGKQNSKVKKHNHKETQLFICIEGKIEFTINNKNIILSKGHSLLVDSFQWHEFNFIESSKIIIVYNV